MKVHKTATYSQCLRYGEVDPRSLSFSRALCGVFLEKDGCIHSAQWKNVTCSACKKLRPGTKQKPEAED